MKFEVLYKIGSNLAGPYSYIVTASNVVDAIDKFKREWQGFRTFVCEVTEVSK